jgi:hypothetical protein
MEKPSNMGTPDKLSAIAGIKANIAGAITNKGVTVPANATFRSYATLINQISSTSDPVSGAVSFTDPPNTSKTQNKLQYLENTKNAIRNTILSKGVDVPLSSPFSDYPLYIAEIGTGGGGNPTVWNLVWEDTFPTTTLNSTNWWTGTKDPASNNADTTGGYNEELQAYKSANVTIETVNGANALCLTAKQEASGTSPARNCTSGIVHTKNKRLFNKGRIDCSIMIPPTNLGLWPAFWLLTNSDSNFGEIDIMEMGESYDISSGRWNKSLTASYWIGPSYEGSGLNYLWTYQTAASSIQDGNFHLFTIIKDDTDIKLYLDLDPDPNVPITKEPYSSLTFPAGRNPDNYGESNGYLYGCKAGVWGTMPTWSMSQFNIDYYIIINLAVGGTYPFGEDVTMNVAPNTVANVTAWDPSKEAKLYVKYIKVYSHV